MSIRWRLALWVAASVCLVGAVISAVGYALVRSSMIEAFEREAVDQLQAVGNAVRVWTDGEVYVELNPDTMVAFAAGGDSAFVVRQHPGGELIDQSASLTASSGTLRGLRGANAAEPVFGSGTAPGGAPALLVTQILPAQHDWDPEDPEMIPMPGVERTTAEVTVAIGRRPLDAGLRRLTVLLGVAVLGSALAAALAALMAARRVLAPLDRMALRAAEIREPTYDRPFPERGPQELRPIASRLNDLLARLADAALVERRFTANAAHELRTPIAELRMLTDVALRFPTAPEQLPQVIASSNAISARLSSLVDALMAIARTDAVAEGLRHEPLDLAALLRARIEAHRAAAETRGVTFEAVLPAQCRLMSDEAVLLSVLDNLIGNACSHAPGRTVVSVILEVRVNGFCLCIANPAPDLAQEDIDRLFEPFWRRSSHHVAESHAGLGLALARGFARIVGLTLEARLDADDRLVMKLETKETENRDAA
ncbi:ATP-binding protein [Sulfitobacter sp. LCG007]